jgi:hypothetical protein
MTLSGLVIEGVEQVIVSLITLFLLRPILVLPTALDPTVHILGTYDILYVPFVSTLAMLPPGG